MSQVQVRHSRGTSSQQSQPSDTIDHPGKGIARKSGAGAVKPLCIGLAITVGIGGMLLLAACTMAPNAALLSDAEALATATVCGCAPYGSYPHSRPSATATPTGTWAPPTPTRTFTPTPPPPGCDYCTMPPAPTRTPVSWPPPMVTCTTRPDQPTLTPDRRDPPAVFPTLPSPTPLPALIGNTQPVVLSNLPGEALPGGVAADPTTGQPYIIWSQLDPDFANSPGNGVYLARPAGAHSSGVDIRSVNGPGTYRVYDRAGATAVAVAPDGTVYVAYTRSEQDQAVALLDERHSTDHGQTWSVPYTFPYNSLLGLISSLRLVVDAQGQPHLAAIAKIHDGDETQPTSGVIDYYERRPDGTWLATRHPVRGKGGRQSGVVLTTFPLADGTIRTALLWDEDQCVYSAYKDGAGGAWSAPVMLVDGTNPPDGIPDYEPGFANPPGNAMQIITFPYQDRQWVYGFWSLYSTGRLCYVFSSDGGVTWSSEDALGYHPIYHEPATPVPGGGPPRVWGSVHWPSAFWDPVQARLFVVYQYCDKRPARAICFPAYAFSRPGTAGLAWTGYTDPTHEPLRLLRATYTLTADTLAVTPAALANSGLVWLTWRGQLSSAETYVAGLSPVTLLSGGFQP